MLSPSEESISSALRAVTDGRYEGTLSGSKAALPPLAFLLPSNEAKSCCCCCCCGSDP
jgi:hypothetical protein